MRSASVRTEPSLAWKVSATASTTFGLTSELPCTANVAPHELLEAAEAERLACRVVDAAQLADRLRVLADVDVDRLPVRTAGQAGPRIGDEHGRRLRFAVTAVAAEALARIQRFNQPIGKVSG